MRRIFSLAAVLAVTFCLMFHVEHSEAQTMDIGAFITSPQSGEVGLEGRTFGYGFSATYAYTQAHEVIHPVGTLQYHNHNRAEVKFQDLEFIAGNDRDFWAGVGLRLTKWNLYAQGMGGFVQKRDALVDKENDTVVAWNVGWGFQPGTFGVAGGWYFSEFGTQYAAGVNLRF